MGCRPGVRGGAESAAAANDRPPFPTHPPPQKRDAALTPGLLATPTGKYMKYLQTEHGGASGTALRRAAEQVPHPLRRTAEQRARLADLKPGASADVFEKVARDTGVREVTGTRPAVAGAAESKAGSADDSTCVAYGREVCGSACECARLKARVGRCGERR